MARGITESDVHTAADELVANGERPTVERIRAHLGTGSPNTVVRWLETWWQGLGSRLANERQVRVATANAPETVVALAGQWWKLALDYARSHAEEALASERTTLQDARDTLERDRHSMQAELAQLRGETEAAHHAEWLATARATELERLVEQLQRRIDETGQQRDVAMQRITEADEIREALQVQLQQIQEATQAERENLIQHGRATEGRAHAEVDRARQETRAAQLELAALRKENRTLERKQVEASERARADASNLSQELTSQRARADAFEAQLAQLRDLPDVLKAAWREHNKPKDSKPGRPRRVGGNGPRN